MARTTPGLQLHQNTLLFTVSSSLRRNGNAYNRLPFASLFFTSNLSPRSFHFNVNRVSLPSLSSSSTPRVSTVPVEHVPPAPDFDFHQEISRLNTLLLALSGSQTLDDKLRLLSNDSRINQFFAYKHIINELYAITDLGKYDLYLIKCLVAAGQGHVISSGLEFSAEHHNNNWIESDKGSLKSALYSLAEMIDRWDGVNGIEGGADNKKKKREERLSALKELLKTLADVERFYDCIGGIIGYQMMVLELLTGSPSQRHNDSWSNQMNETMQSQILEIHSPSGIDLSQNTEYAFQAALWGVEGLPDLGEIYPLGGSADRLGLVDPDTGECLPAAMLPYCGRTLLEGLIRDLQAREFLFFKLYGKQCITPVAIMTSSAKSNHERVTSLCEKLQWFGRGQSNFRLFEQPLVPAVGAEDGQWMVCKPFAPVCKPGGHGVIWKLAYDKGVFQWFYDHGRKGATVRQVSNVVAATDLTLLALAGIGLHHGKKLGFASCKRRMGATEGINVLLEKRNLDGEWAYGLSCIEYTEFEKFGIADVSVSHDSLQADFPANTNILYVDLHSAELVGSRNSVNSLPGMVLNVKKPVVYMDQFGIHHSVPGGRLECTMQNIADNFFNKYSSRCNKSVEDELDTFLVYNERRRVTSSAKKKRRQSDKSMSQTPEGSLLDIMRNAYDLLSECEIQIPEIEANDKYAESGPPYLILLHPALGPVWEVTRQKFRGGAIGEGSELLVEVAEFLWRDVQLDGSMIIEAENILGSTRINGLGEPILQFGNRCSKCKLQNVTVQNKGIDWNSSQNVYWKHEVRRVESLKIILHGNAEFEANDVTLQGNHVFEVPDGHKLRVTSGNQGITLQLDPIDDKMMDSGSWHWKYGIEGKHIRLELVEL